MYNNSKDSFEADDCSKESQQQQEASQVVIEEAIKGSKRSSLECDKEVGQGEILEKQIKGLRVYFDGTLKTREKLFDLLRDNRSETRSRDSEVERIYMSLQQLSPEPIIVAGGYPTYLLGYTKSFGDVDYFMYWPDLKNKLSVKTLNESTGLTWESINKEEVLDSYHFFDNNYDIFQATVNNQRYELICLFNIPSWVLVCRNVDFLLPRNVFWRDMKTGEWKHKGALELLLRSFSEIKNGEDLKKMCELIMTNEQNPKNLQDRIEKYSAREAIPGITRICASLRVPSNDEIQRLAAIVKDNDNDSDADEYEEEQKDDDTAAVAADDGSSTDEASAPTKNSLKSTML